MCAVSAAFGERVLTRLTLIATEVEWLIANAPGSPARRAQRRRIDVAGGTAAVTVTIRAAHAPPERDGARSPEPACMDRISAPTCRRRISSVQVTGSREMIVPV